MEQHPPYKIVVIGPESTGKSSLCEQLARHFDVLWCPEFARTYLENPQHPSTYTAADLLQIAKGQLEAESTYLEKARARNDRFLLIDTDMYIMKVWSEFAFQDCHHWILEQIALRHYDYYLLCDIDLPWTPDPLREYPDLGMRRLLFDHYQDHLVHQKTPFTIIRGQDRIRADRAIEALNNAFAGTH